VEGLPGITRRAALRNSAAAAVAVYVAAPGSALGDVAVPVRAGTRGYLRPDRLSALRGFVDTLIPGTSADDVGGALAGGCAEAIDALLAAFEYKPPRIYAGAPFSDRGGSPKNDFRRFIRLDSYEEKAWRLRIQGSRGRRRLEFNGPVKGWQGIYDDGLDALNDAAGGNFGDAPYAQRESLVRGSGDAAVGELVDVAFPHAYQFMYGAPEYRGNRDLLGWRYTNFDGDVLPRGWTRAEIEGPPEALRSAAESRRIDEDLHRELRRIGVTEAALTAAAAVGSAEAAHGVLARGERLSAIRAELAPLVEWIEKGGFRGA
jgi:hypothetical protein